MKTRWSSFDNWPVFAQLITILTPIVFILWLAKVRVEEGSASVTWIIAMAWGTLLAIPWLIMCFLWPTFVRSSWYYDLTYFLGLLFLAWFIGNPFVIYLGTFVAFVFIGVLKRILLR